VASFFWDTVYFASLSIETDQYAIVVKAVMWYDWATDFDFVLTVDVDHEENRQPTWSQSTNVTDRRTDRQTDTMQSQYRAMHIVHRAVKTMRLQNLISSFTVHTFMPDFVYFFQINWKMLDISYH